MRSPARPTPPRTARSQLDRASPKKPRSSPSSMRRSRRWRRPTDRAARPRHRRGARARARHRPPARRGARGPPDRALAEINEQLPVCASRRPPRHDELAARADARSSPAPARGRRAVERPRAGDPCPVCGVALAEAVAVDPDATRHSPPLATAEQIATERSETAERALTGAETKPASPRPPQRMSRAARRSAHRLCRPAATLGRGGRSGDRRVAPRAPPS